MRRSRSTRHHPLIAFLSFAGPLGLALVLVFASNLAAALPKPGPEDRAGWVWQPVDTFRRVDTTTLQARPPHVQGELFQGRLASTVGPSMALMFWMPAFSTVRVRVTGDPEADDPVEGPPKLRFSRFHPGRSDSVAWIEAESLSIAEGVWVLHHPMGYGTPWLVQSDRPVDIIVEEPAPREAKRLWEPLAEEIARWVAGSGPMPSLPPVEGADRYLRQLRADLELGALIARLPGYDSASRDAVLAWRTARALIGLDTLRPLLRSNFVSKRLRPETATEAVLPHRELGLHGALERPSSPYLYYTPEDDWTVDADGPGVLRLYVRGLFAPGGPEQRLMSVVVTSEGRVVHRVDTIVEPARVRDPESLGSPLPEYMDASSTTGSRISSAIGLSVPLLMGKHSYEISVRGLGSIVKARAAIKVAAAQDFAERRSIQTEIRRARSKLEGRVGLASEVLTHLVSRLEGPGSSLDAAVAADLAQVTPRLALLLELENTLRRPSPPAVLAEAAERLSRGLPEPAAHPSDLDILLRVRTFELFMAGHRPDRAVEVLRDHAQWLVSDEFEALVFAVQDPEQLWPIAGALDVVARKVPFTAGLRRAYQELWSWTRWARLDPEDEIESWTWVEMPPPDAPLVETTELEPGTLWPVPADLPVDVEAPAHPFERERVPILRLLLYPPTSKPPPSAPPWVSIEVDDQHFEVPVLGAPELFEVMVPVGRHRLRVRPSEGVRVLSTLHPPRTQTSISTPSPVRTRMWPAVHEGAPVAFVIPQLAAGGVLRLDLRDLDPPRVVPQDEPPPPSRRLTLRTDTGLERTIEWKPGVVDPRVLSKGGPSHVTDRTSLVVPIDTEATRIWLEGPALEDVAVAFSLRQWDLPEPTLPRGSGFEGDPYARIEALTRTILEHPDALAPRVARGHRLLDVGSAAGARRDLEDATALLREDAERDDVLAVHGLRARLQAYVTDDYVDVPEGPARAGPQLLSPPLTALGEAETIRAALARAVSSEPVPADAFLDVEVARAALAIADARPLEAFVPLTRAYERHDRRNALPFGWGAAHAFAEHERSGQPLPDPELRLLAYGLLDRLRARVDVGWLRWLHNGTAQSSHWDRLELVDRSVGTKDVPRAPEHRTRSRYTRLHWALTAPPFEASEGRLLRAGSTVSFDLQNVGTGSVELESWCADLEARLGQVEKSAMISVRVDGVEAQPIRSPPRTSTRRLLGPMEPGDHRIELVLPDRPEAVVCALRWVPDPTAVGLVAPRPPLLRRWFVAEPGAPVEIAVAGPTAVGVYVRPVDEAVSEFDVELVRSELDGRDRRSESMHASWPLEDVDGGPLAVNRTVLVTSPSPVRLSIRPTATPVLVRLYLRQADEPALAPPPEAPAAATSSAAAAESEPASPQPSWVKYWPAPPPRATPDQVGEPPEVLRNRFGSTEFEFRFSRRDIADADDPRPRNQIRGTVSWRREMLADKVWLKLFGRIQGREGAGAAASGGATLYGQLDPRRLRGTLHLDFWGEEYRGGSAWSARVSTEVDRPIQVFRTVVLVPGVLAAVRYQALDEPQVDQLLEPTHAEVYNQYIEDHPFALVPNVKARWYPYRDLAVLGETSLTMNSDLQSVDHYDLGGGVEGLLETPYPLFFRYGAGYNVSNRFADRHRPSFFARHELSFQAGLIYTLVGLGRISLDLRDTVFVTPRFPVRNNLDVILAFDLALGRGVTDTSPMEMLFRELLQLEWWREAREDDLL